MKKTQMQFIEMLRQAYKEGCSVQIPYRIKNGEFVDLDFFHLLSNLGDDETITVISKSNTKLVLEIQSTGAGKIVEVYEKLVEDIKNGEE